MTNKEKIKAEIKRLKIEKRKENLPFHALYYDGYDAACNKIIAYLNSLPAEQQSEDMEKFIQDLIDKYPVNKESVPNDSLNDYYQGLRFGVLQGAQWQKEQMMKGLCYETKVYRDEEGDGIDTPIESWLALENNEITNLPNIGLEDGDKVKVIIVKEAEQ